MIWVRFRNKITELYIFLKCFYNALPHNLKLEDQSYFRKKVGALLLEISPYSKAEFYCHFGGHWTVIFFSNIYTLPQYLLYFKVPNQILTMYIILLLYLTPIYSIDTLHYFILRHFLTLILLLCFFFFRNHILYKTLY